MTASATEDCYSCQASSMTEQQQPILAPLASGSGVLPPVANLDIPEPAVITDQEVGEYREQDRFLPVRLLQDSLPDSRSQLHFQIANVSRIMKAAVPSNSKIAKEAKECVQECVSEFIAFVTSEAADRAAMEKRKTIGGEDILNAMQNLGFENYAEALKIWLVKMRQVSCATSLQKLGSLYLFLLLA